MPTVTRTDTVPLTWAQRAWLHGPPRLDEHDAWRHNVDLNVRVPPGFTREQAGVVIHRLVATYPSLRSQLCTDADGRIVQRVTEPDDPALAESIRRLAVLPFDPLGGEPADQLRRQADALLRAPAGPNLALLLSRHGGTAWLRLAHAFVDAGGANALLAAFAGLVDSATPPDPHNPQDLLYRRIEFERGATGAAMSAGAVRYLTDTASAAVGLGMVDRQRQVRKGDVPGCRGTSDGLFGLLAGAGSASRLTRAAVLLSLALLAYCRVRDRCSAWISVNVANRMSAAERDFVGLAIQNSWLVERFTPSMRFADLVRSVAARLVSCVRHGRYDPDDLAGLPAAGLPSVPNFYFNYAESVGVQWRRTEPTGGAELDPGRFEWLTMPTGGGGCPFEFNAYAVPGTVVLELKYDDVLLTRADIIDIIGFLRTATTRLSTLDVLVADLLAGGGR